MYPVMLNVGDQQCLVVGGGGVALRKVDGLLAEGAQVTVVASEPIARLVELAGEGAIALERRPYQNGEAATFALVIAATDDRSVNRQVFEDARAARVWVNVADDPELCTFQLPARVQRGAMQLAIASAGSAPFVVRRLRQMFERRLGHEWAEWMDAAARFRNAVRGAGLPLVEREKRYDAFFAATVDPERLRVTLPTPAQEAALLAEGSVLAASGATDSSESPARSRAAAAQPVGAAPAVLVSLVGAGPGDPGLLTLRGRQRLFAADHVVYDRLAAPALPPDLPARIELHCVGKRTDHHPVPQEEINATLVRLAQQGKRVVRLKGGDPYVFGRGGEEAEALAEAGVPFEVVPCVTSGVAAPAYAGIPLTHRREVVQVTFVTAHESVKSTGPHVRWDLLGADPHATLVGYMGVSRVDKVARDLMASGLSADTPAAMIERGSTPGQRVVRARIEDLAAEVEKAGLRPPALFVIGPTVGRAEQLDWFGARPLAGERLVIAAPAGALGDCLGANGAEVIEVPQPATPAARVVMDALPLTGCILRSPDEVELFDEERSGVGWDVDVVGWCLGDEVAHHARELRWTKIEVLASDVDERALVAAISAKRARSAS